MPDWPGTANRVEQPVICLHGGGHSVTPICFVREYVDAARNRQLIELSERGQLLLYAEPAKIVEILLPLFDDAI